MVAHESLAKEASALLEVIAAKLEKTGRAASSRTTGSAARAARCASPSPTSTTTATSPPSSPRAGC